MSEQLFIFVYKTADGMGEHYIVDLSKPNHVEWLHQQLGICRIKTQLKELQQRLVELEDKIDILERPLRIAKLKELLASEPQGRTEQWIKNRIPKLRYNEIRIFEEMGVIEKFLKDSTKYKVPLYRLKKEEASPK